MIVLYSREPQTVQHMGCEIPERIGELIWSDCSYSRDLGARGEWVCQKLHSPFLIQNSISQLRVPQVIHQTWLQYTFIVSKAQTSPTKDKDMPLLETV